jgi:thiol-disulfide isomerase/thioredoxin
MWEAGMITRRFLMLAAGASALPLPALAKENDTTLPPPLPQLSGLALTQADGTATTLGAELGSGRATLVSLWATWCGPCVQEAQHLAKLRTARAPDKLDIIGINVERKRDEQKIAAFLKKGKVNYPQFRGDPEATYIAFGGSLPITLPRLYVFSASGTPLAMFGRYDGGKTLKAIDAALATALKG